MLNKYQPCTLRSSVPSDSSENEVSDIDNDIKSSKKSIYFKFFSIWFLILPFTVISSIFAGFSIDKVAAPILIVVWAGMYLSGQSKLCKGKLPFILVAFLFFFIRNISYIDDLSLFSSFVWEDAIRLGYFCLPILFIDSYKKVKTAAFMISINATVGCVSAFMVALGLLTLPYERFSLSRIGFGIDKSIGLISAYGDLAQFSACFLLLAILIPSSLFINKKLAIFSAFSIVLMGLVGNQSRSFLLSVIAALMVSYFYSFRSDKRQDSFVFTAVLIFSVVLLMSIIGVFFSDIVGLLSGMGGSQAKATAEGRLSQYQMAFDLIKSYPLLGVDSTIFSKNSQYIHGIHNMWLGQLTRGGFISTIILLSIFFMLYRSSVELFTNTNTRPYALLSIGYMFAVLVSTLFYPADSSLFWALMGMLVAIITTLKSSKTRHKNV